MDTVDGNGRPIVFTVAQAADVMRCSEDSVYHLIASGDLRAFTVGKAGKRILASVLYAYMGADAQPASDRHLRAAS